MSGPRSHGLDSSGTCCISSMPSRPNSTKSSRTRAGRSVGMMPGRSSGAPVTIRRCDVQAAARLQVAAGGQDVHVYAATLFAVQDRRPRVAVGVQSGPGRLLELVEDAFDLQHRSAGPPVPTRSRPSGTCAQTPASRRRRAPCPGLRGGFRRPRARASSRRVHRGDSRPPRGSSPCRAGGT